MRYNIDPKRHIARARRFFAGLVLASAAGLSPRPEPDGPRDAGPHHAAGRPLSFPGRSSGGHARVHLPAHQRRRGNRFLDRETLSSGSDPLPACLRTGHPDRDALPESGRQSRTTRRRARFRSAARPGRAHSTPAGFGRRCCTRTAFPRAPTPRCPNTGSIPCLLLQSIGSQPGPSGGTMLSKTTFIQRLNTRGGVAPADGCSTSADVGNQTLVPYTADYYFYRKNN